jgi:hypothetical protein
MRTLFSCLWKALFDAISSINQEHEASLGEAKPDEIFVHFLVGLGLLFDVMTPRVLTRSLLRLQKRI